MVNTLKLQRFFLSSPRTYVSLSKGNSVVDTVKSNYVIVNCKNSKKVYQCNHIKQVQKVKKSSNAHCEAQIQKAGTKMLRCHFLFFSCFLLTPRFFESDSLLLNEGMIFEISKFPSFDTLEEFLNSPQLRIVWNLKSVECLPQYIFESFKNK